MPCAKVITPTQHCQNHPCPSYHKSSISSLNKFTCNPTLAPHIITLPWNRCYGSMIHSLWGSMSCLPLKLCSSHLGTTNLFTYTVCLCLIVFVLVIVFVFELVCLLLFDCVVCLVCLVCLVFLVCLIVCLVLWCVWCFFLICRFVDRARTIKSSWIWYDFGFFFTSLFYCVLCWDQIKKRHFFCVRFLRWFPK